MLFLSDEHIYLLKTFDYNTIIVTNYTKDYNENGGYYEKSLEYHVKYSVDIIYAH